MPSLLFGPQSIMKTRTKLFGKAQQHFSIRWRLVPVKFYFQHDNALMQLIIEAYLCIYGSVNVTIIYSVNDSRLLGPKPLARAMPVYFDEYCIKIKDAL